MLYPYEVFTLNSGCLASLLRLRSPSLGQNCPGDTGRGDADGLFEGAIEVALVIEAVGDRNVGNGWSLWSDRLARTSCQCR